MIAACRLPIPVGRQVQQGRSARKALAPVVDLLLQRLSLQPVSLPERIVRILNGKRRQRRGLVAQVGVVKSAELLRQNALRPAIGGDMVKRQQEGMLLLGKLQNGSAYRPVPPQIERPLRLLLAEPERLLLPLVL